MGGYVMSSQKYCILCAWFKPSEPDEYIKCETEADQDTLNSLGDCTRKWNHPITGKILYNSPMMAYQARETICGAAAVGFKLKEDT
jgi:hypothetical protein